MEEKDEKAIDKPDESPTQDDTKKTGNEVLEEKSSEEKDDVSTENTEDSPKDANEGEITEEKSDENKDDTSTTPTETNEKAEAKEAQGSVAASGEAEPADAMEESTKTADIVKETAEKIEAAKETKGTGKEEQFVVFTIAGEEFGVNISEVLEITKLKDVTRVPNIEEYIEGVINLRGRIHIVINLSKKIQVPSKKADNDTRIVVVESGEDRVGMLVDSVTEVLRVGEDNIKPAPEIIERKVNSEYITGVIILGERLIILLDLIKLLGKEEIEAIEKAKKAAPPPPTV